MPAGKLSPPPHPTVPPACARSCSRHPTLCIRKVYRGEGLGTAPGSHGRWTLHRFRSGEGLTALFSLSLSSLHITLFSLLCLALYIALHIALVPVSRFDKILDLVLIWFSLLFLSLLSLSSLSLSLSLIDRAPNRPPAPSTPQLYIRPLCLPLPNPTPPTGRSMGQGCEGKKGRGRKILEAQRRRRSATFLFLFDEIIPYSSRSSGAAE